MTDLRYNPFNTELRRVFGCRVQRVTLDAGFSCPNRDGTVGRGGCSYCSGAGAGAPGIPRGASLTDQLAEGKSFTARRYNLPKDDCRFKCLEHPCGMALNTRDGQPFLALNGIQTQSARVYNLVQELPVLRALGVSTARRAETMPEIPTLAEQGVEGFDVSSWYGIAAPAAAGPDVDGGRRLCRS